MAWLRFFIGTPQRLLATLAVLGGITVVLCPGLLYTVLSRLVAELSPLLQLGFFILIVWVIIRLFLGHKYHIKVRCNCFSTCLFKFVDLCDESRYTEIIMKQSHFFAKIKKEASKEAETISHQYLTRADFIDQLATGIYSFLPLGWRVHQKIEKIIREEMNAIDGQEVFLPTLQPKDIWLETDRWQKIDPPLFKLKDRHERELALGSTHEEVITDLVRRRVKSYKDLPLSLYQIQNKFRNEMRSSGGLLRVREFIMKDMYSFHQDKNDLDKYYEKVKKSYLNIFQRCGLEVAAIEALGGTIGGSETHEFALLAETGEDKVIVCPKCGWAANLETGEKIKCPKCQAKTETKNSIENGHIFKLGTTYSEKMKAYFTDQKGQQKPLVMGCYGIGLGRLMAAIVEAHHDQHGIIWPEAVAPFSIHLLTINGQDSKLNHQIKKQAEKLYSDFLKQGDEVLYDDRDDKSPGEKFAEADLIGIPWRIVISEKTLTKNSVEVKKRSDEKTELIKFNLCSTKFSRHLPRISALI